MLRVISAGPPLGLSVSPIRLPIDLLSSRPQVWASSVMTLDSVLTIRKGFAWVPSSSLMCSAIRVPSCFLSFVLCLPGESFSVLAL